MIPVADAIQIVLSQTSTLSAESVPLSDALARILAEDVQQVELTREVDGARLVEILESVEAGRSIVRQAQEIKRGETVLHAGDDINAQTIATLASFGYAQVKVGQRPRVAVMATGSELVNVDEKPGVDEIRDSNNYTLEAYAKLAGATV